MMLSLPSLLLGAQLITAAADQVPRYDIDAQCRADAWAFSAGPELSQTLASCKQDEQNARDQLVKQWTQFKPADRAMCTALSSETDAHSYIELLTCLEMARDTRTPPVEKQGP
jgi:hypothetical protein